MKLTVSINSLLCQLRTVSLPPDKTAAANTGLTIAELPCIADTLAQGGNSALQIKFSAIPTRHRKQPKRYSQA